MLVGCGVLDPEQDPRTLVEQMLVDPVRVFVKQEPHKWSKVVTGRWRLIASVSSLDSGVERVLYQCRSKLEIANWDSVPSKPGMGATDADLKTLGNQLQELLGFGNLVDSDVSGWDWQWKQFIAMSIIYVDALAFDVGPESDLFKAMWNREVCALNTTFSLSNGKMLVLRNKGIQLSGRFVTSYKNSKGRVFNSALAGTYAMAMGDDCCETLNGLALQELEARYDSQGYKGLVEYKETNDVNGTIFCSTRFFTLQGNYIGEPVNWHRTLFRLISKGRKEVPAAEVAQFSYEIRNLRIDQVALLREIYRDYLADAEFPAPQQ